MCLPFGFLFCFVSNFDIDGWVFITDYKFAQLLLNWVYFKENVVKSAQFGQKFSFHGNTLMSGNGAKK